VWLALAQTAAASSSGALRSYEDGHYQSSFLEYKRLLDKNPQDPRLSFNAGSAAYQAKQYDEAVSLFSEALKSQDIKLQEQAFYNLGNTQFRAGQGMTEPQQQQQAWEAAVQNFENARKLNPKDEDAKFNLEVVKKKLEELKKQREQSQKDKPNQDQKDDKKDQKDDKKDQDKQDPKDQNKDQKQDSSKDQQNKQPDQQPDKPGQKDQQNKPQDKKDPGTNQPPHPEPKKDEDKKQAKAPKPEKGDQQKKGDDEPKPAEGTKGDQKPPNAQSGNTAPLPVGVMSKEQAERLLDALKREEKAMIFKPQAPSKSQPRSFKDWWACLDRITAKPATAYSSRSDGRLRLEPGDKSGPWPARKSAGALVNESSPPGGMDRSGKAPPHANARWRFLQTRGNARMNLSVARADALASGLPLV